MKNRLFRYIVGEDNQPLTIHSYIRMRKSKIYKNLMFLSLSQSTIFVMYKTMMMLHEYEHDFLGIWSYTMFNVTKIFGFLLLPKFVLSLYGLQNTLRYGMVIYSFLIFAHYVHMLGIVIPVAMLMGFVGSTMWVSVQLYIYKLARIMSKVSGDDLETTLLRFSGIFFSIYRSYDIICYLPMAFVPSSHTTLNKSRNNCGPNFHFGDYSSLSEFTLPPRNEKSYIATLSIILLSICGLLISIFFIDPPHKLTATYLGLEDYSQGLSRTFRLFRRRRLQFMIPMSIFAGYEKITKSYDFSTAYVGCTEITARVIYVYFLGCLASSQMSLGLPPLVEMTSIQILLATAAAIHLISILILLLKDHTSLIGCYAISVTWGLASATWDGLLYVLYGMLSYGDELEGFCHLGFWYSIGAFSNLFMTRLVPVSVKLWMALICLIFASISVLMLPYIINYTRKKVGPIEGGSVSQSVNSRNSRQSEVDDRNRNTNVYFGKNSANRQYHPAEVKSISTSRIHHVAIPKTRPRFDRHNEVSSEDGESS